jgi:hypothetical protein
MLFRVEAVGTDRYVELVQLHRSVVMAASAVATKLRLTPRSSVDRYVRKVAPSGLRPWEDNVEPEQPEPA